MEAPVSELPEIDFALKLICRRGKYSVRESNSITERICTEGQLPPKDIRMSLLKAGRSQPSSGPNAKNPFVLYALGISIPAVIAIYWPLYWHHPDRTAETLRPAILGLGILMVVFCGRRRLSTSETRLAGFFGLYCALWLGSSLGSVQVDRAMTDWLKLFVLCCIAVLLSRPLRSPAIRRPFGLALIACSVVISVYMAFCYVFYAGWVIPTYESARAFKGFAERVNIPLNAITFSSVFSYITGMCIIRSNSYLKAAGLLVLAVSTVLTGSRAPLASFLLSAFGLLILNGIRNRKILFRWATWALVGCSLAVACYLVATVSPKQWSELSEGRSDLWSVALDKFSERPLIGFGFESFSDDLVSRSPGYYKIKWVKSIIGGYHNVYLTALAEEGLMGFTALVALTWFMMSSCWQLAFLRWQTWHCGQWAMFGALFIAIRGMLETAGIFGYAREPADFLGFIFLSVMVSAFSIEEEAALDFRKHLVPSTRSMSESARGSLAGAFAQPS